MKMTQSFNTKKNKVPKYIKILAVIIATVIALIIPSSLITEAHAELILNLSVTLVGFGLLIYSLPNQKKNKDLFVNFWAVSSFSLISIFSMLIYVSTLTKNFFRFGVFGFILSLIVILLILRHHKS